MRKMKKINGYLVVRFNDREKQGYPTLGSFGVIDAELYTGILDVDRSVMEYDDAETLEIAAEQARDLDAEQDFSDEPPIYTVVTETAEESKEEEIEPTLLVNGMETKLKAQIKSKSFPYITPNAAAHELVGYKTALYDLGLLGEDDAVTDLHHFGELCEFQDEDGHHVNVALLTPKGMARMSPHDFEEGKTITGCTVQILRCRRCGMESFAWIKGTTSEQEVERDTFVNLGPNTENGSLTRKIYALGQLLENNCPENDCHVYLNIFRMAKSLDATLDGLDASGYPAQVLRRDLRKQLTELLGMYLENYAVRKFREEMQK